MLVGLGISFFACGIGAMILEGLGTALTLSIIGLILIKVA